MANETKEKKIPLYLQEIEARELGRLIEEDVQADIDDEKFGNRLKEGYVKFKSDKKAVVFSILLVIMLISVVFGLYSIINDYQPTDERGISKKSIDTANTQNLKPIVFGLDAFFLPLMSGGKETGKFITVKAELILSNQMVLKEVELALPLIRQNIYALLKRKKALEYVERKKSLEEKIKREIITSTNTTLISGVGSIEDVFFSQFIVN